MTPTTRERREQLARTQGWRQLNGAWIHPGGYAKRLPSLKALQAVADGPKQIVKLVFDMMDPASMAKCRRALHADDAYGALWAIVNDIIRPMVKYDDEPNRTIAERIQKQVYDAMTERGIDLDRDYD